MVILIGFVETNIIHRITLIKQRISGICTGNEAFFCNCNFVKVVFDFNKMQFADSNAGFSCNALASLFFCRLCLA
jgi:F0F1-type ATP synthase assembly protein I